MEKIKPMYSGIGNCLVFFGACECACRRQLNNGYMCRGDIDQFECRIRFELMLS